MSSNVSFFSPILILHVINIIIVLTILSKRNKKKFKGSWSNILVIYLVFFTTLSLIVKLTASITNNKKLDSDSDNIVIYSSVPVYAILFVYIVFELLENLFR